MHGTLANISVAAISSAGLQSAVLSKVILIDRTAPTEGTILMKWALRGGRPALSTTHCISSEVAYIQLLWNGFMDEESGIRSYTVYADSSGLRSRVAANALLPVANRSKAAWPRSAGLAQTLIVPAPLSSDGLTTFRVEACNGVGLCTSSPNSTALHVVSERPIVGTVRLEQSTFIEPIVGMSNHTPSPGYASNPWVPINASWSGFSSVTTGSLAYEACVGSSTHACQVAGPIDVKPERLIDRSSGGVELPWGQHDLRCGHRYFLSIRVTDCAGLRSWTLSPPLKVCCDPPRVVGVAIVPLGYNASADIAAGISGYMAGVSFVTPHDTPALSWTGVVETCSGIRQVAAEFVEAVTGRTVAGWQVSNWSLASQQGFRSVPVSALQSLTPGAVYRVRLTAISHAGWESADWSYPFMFDATPPEVGDIVEGGAPGASSCFTPGLDKAISVGWSGFVDRESRITAVDVGLGSTPGALDLMPYMRVGQTSLGQAVIPLAGYDAAAVGPGQRIYAAVRATNGAGLSVNASSDKGFLVVEQRAEPTVCM